MLLPTNIHTLLSGNVVEWARIEFKASWKPEASLKTICAFANDIDNWGSGYIILGVEENNGMARLPVKGIPENKVDAVMKDLLNKCKLIKPDYLPVVAPVDYQGKKLIVIWCPGGPTRPYKSPADFSYKGGKAVPAKEHIYFIRKMASTVKPSEAETAELFSLANNVPFDDRINHQAELSDLNITLIKAYLKEIGSDMYPVADRMPFEDLCVNMGISNSMPEYLKPKNVGLMFFCMNPERFIPYTQIDVVEFPQGAGGDEIIEKIFRGPIHQQLREALLYINNNVIKEKIIKYPDRPEADRYFNYPLTAVEEALANAVYHKGYDIREPIEVRIEPEMIEIISHPGADRSVTREGLKKYRAVSRRYRNRRIGEFLKELHLTEGRNTGFWKIRKALADNCSPEPEFEMDDDRTYFISRLHINSYFQAEKLEIEVSKSEIETPKSEIEKVRKQAVLYGCSEKYTAKIEKLYADLPNEQVFSSADIQRILGCAGSTAALMIKKLKEMNMLTAVKGQGKGKYHFTGMN